jgi:hypothetical protein
MWGQVAIANQTPGLVEQAYSVLLRSNVRPERMQKLKVVANSGQNPGFDFLLSCWNDDPALVIVIKKLLAKFPQWGVVVVDGELAN